MFKVGSKVVYTGKGTHGSPTGDGKTQVLLSNHVYTIREIDLAYIERWGMAGIRVEEARQHYRIHNGKEYEPATLANNFEPLVEPKKEQEVSTEKKPSLSLLQALLKTKSVKELVPDER